MELPKPLPTNELLQIRQTVEAIIKDRQKHPQWKEVHFRMKYGTFAREKPRLFKVAMVSDDADLAVKLIDVLSADDGKSQAEKESLMGKLVHDRLTKQ